MLGEVLEDRKGRHRENLLFTHQPHRLVAKLIGMINRSYSRPRREKRARLAGGMHCHTLAEARSLLDLSLIHI